MDKRRHNALQAALLAVLFLVNVNLSLGQRTRCESFCRFRFCVNLVRDGLMTQLENRAVLLGIPNEAFGPFPCFQPSRRGSKIRILRNVTGGEARVSPEFSGKKFVPISKFMRRSVKPNFSADQFQWFDNIIRQSPGRIRSRGNQERALDKLCVQMPISSYQLLRRDGSVRKSVRTRGKRACVGFRTQVAKLLVLLRWDSADDFDMSLKEPNGFVISRFGTSDESPNGGSLILDNGSLTCQNEIGNEKIRYLLDATVESGTYVIRISRNRACQPSSKYALRVLHRGRLILDHSGVVSEVGEDLIVRRFMIS